MVSTVAYTAKLCTFWVCRADNRTVIYVYWEKAGLNIIFYNANGLIDFKAWVKLSKSNIDHKERHFIWVTC